ncbi:MAG: hypothetical protein OXP69_01220, partial [Spirochaetaceae bacterium]|nr:hypothetical protein [Spirochaetaceae bacterium]
GDSEKKLTVAVIGDTLDEVDETYTVTLSGASNATLSDATGVGTITDDDDPPGLSVDDVTVTEGNSGTVNAGFTVSLSAESGREVTVSWEAASGSGDTATEGTDYTGASGTLTFAAGDTEKTLTVAVTGDTVLEADETYTVTLSGASNATLTDATGTGTITDDDGGGTVSIGDVSVNEGDKARFTVSLSQPALTAAVVSVSTTDGTATAASDYTAVSGTMLTIASGGSNATIEVQTTEDTVVEASETFTATIAAVGDLPTGVTLGTVTGTATITDDDSALVSAAGTSVIEGDPAKFAVSLSQPVTAAVIVNWATDEVLTDTATAGHRLHGAHGDRADVRGGYGEVDADRDGGYHRRR